MAVKNHGRGPVPKMYVLKLCNYVAEKQECCFYCATSIVFENNSILKISQNLKLPEISTMRAHNAEIFVKCARYYTLRNHDTR